MICIYCDGDTRVARTTQSPNGRQIVRRRQCLLISSHRFDTEEGLPAPGLTSIGVIRPGTKRPTVRPFDRQILEKDIKTAILSRMIHDEPDDLEEVVNRTIFRLERSVNLLLQPMPSGLRERWPQLRGTINSLDIAEFVEGALQDSKMRIQRVLYAISVRGRRDMPDREGWDDASALLNWMGSVYPRLRSDPPWRPADREVITWAVDDNPIEPRDIVKVVRPGRAKDALLVPFRKGQFVQGIEIALAGREKPPGTAEKVANMVLTDLRGQTRVHSAQLAFGVMNRLREVDDIAYLRWATVAKRIPDATRFAEEAIGMLRRPSPIVSANGE